MTSENPNLQQTYLVVDELGYYQELVCTTEYPVAGGDTRVWLFDPDERTFRPIRQLFGQMLQHQRGLRWMRVEPDAADAFTELLAENDGFDEDGDGDRWHASQFTCLVRPWDGPARGAGEYEPYELELVPPNGERMLEENSFGLLDCGRPMVLACALNEDAEVEALIVEVEEQDGGRTLWEYDWELRRFYTPVGARLERLQDRYEPLWLACDREGFEEICVLMAVNRGLVDEYGGSPIGEDEVDHLLAKEDGEVIELVGE
jgi:hypothetical protein